MPNWGKFAEQGLAGLHPASLILIWLGFALCLPWLRPADLAATTAVLVFLIRRSPVFFKLLRRTRWLLISLIMVFAFATPGELLIATLGHYSPSREGLLAGGLQALRLLSLLAGLAALLTVLSRDRLLAGLYFLLRPLRLLGVNIDRVAARIWLTLHYAEQKSPGRPREWQETFRAAWEEPVQETQVTLEVGRLARGDYLLLALAAVLLTLLVAVGLGR